MIHCYSWNLLVAMPKTDPQKKSGRWLLEIQADRVRSTEVFLYTDICIVDSTTDRDLLQLADTSP